MSEANVMNGNVCAYHTWAISPHACKHKHAAWGVLAACFCRTPTCFLLPLFFGVLPVASWAPASIRALGAARRAAKPVASPCSSFQLPREYLLCEYLSRAVHWMGPWPISRDGSCFKSKSKLPRYIHLGIYSSRNCLSMLPRKAQNMYRPRKGIEMAGESDDASSWP